jgi:hypothetical protein
LGGETDDGRGGNRRLHPRIEELIMIGRRTIAVLSLLCALALCATAASSAVAAKGTTAFLCEQVGTGAEFKDAHCKESQAGGSGFKHTAIAPGSAIAIEITNEKTKNSTIEATPAKMLVSTSSFIVEIECTGVSGSGTLENQATSPMQTEGKVTGKYTGCTVPKPAGKCKVQGGEIAFEAKASTQIISETPEEMAIKVEPAVGMSFGTVTLENQGANVCPFAGSGPLTGSYSGTQNGEPNGKGATLTVLPESSMSPLKYRGASVLLSQVITVRKTIGGSAIDFTTTT